MPILHWLTRDEDIRAAARIPYQLLEEVPELSVGDPDSGNLLVQGDNIQALKTLLPLYAGRVKCIYIDPPFNTGQAFPDYDDNMAHSTWLAMMYARLELLREFLSETGTIAIHLDDEELAYCVCILDELFGRKNRVNVVTFRQGAAVGHKAINPGLVTVTNYIVIYARNKTDTWKPNRIFTTRDRDKRYANFIENYDDDYRNWRLMPLTRAFAQANNSTPTNLRKRLQDRYEIELNEFVIEHANRVVQLVTPNYSGVGQETREMIDRSLESPDSLLLQKRDRYPDIYLKNGKRMLFYRDKMKEIDGELVAGEPLTNLWDDLLSNNLHNEGDVSFPRGKKPEALVKRLIELFSREGDLILDSFLGSGTTAAVAHKMGRRYIGIEMGEHAITHCVPRLNKVIEGEQGGISKTVNWQGGGGFRFYRLGPPVYDEDGRINKDIRFPVLASHIWFGETLRSWTGEGVSPFLGVHQGHAYALLYNGILGDKRPNGGNVLTRATLCAIRAAIFRDHPTFDGPLTVYGESTRLAEHTLNREHITFKHIPYEIATRD